jgi:hypothetical protein
MLFEITREDIDNILNENFNFHSNQKQQEFIIIEILDMISLDYIVIDETNEDRQAELINKELYKQIKNNIKNIPFLIPLLTQEKLENF